ncbi:MAG: ATP-binding cassette domain-containing protein [Hydrogenophaga sp.]|uniref:ATP-binding cassette domain-containing protein n=2 Tax=Hydrogenophaga sp. TaxID=1904254 RepID=UPI0027358022|nr:ATP-binding cassette domain-containing protein [Hydrogenophaga sp.]MDP3348004.1 ATP-binding cassette domain-containing protein [Hydrogenophaga sp.]
MIDSRGLQFAYPHSEPLRFADVSVAQGGTLLLRGPSGSGKSTWLALASGLLTPTAGEVEVGGQSVGGLSAAARDAWRARHIGFLPQKLHLSDALSVADNLGLVFFAAGLPVDKAAVAGALRVLNIESLAARKPAQLSGGQAQRAALARALLLRPSVILADEPTASLDDGACEASLDLLRNSASKLNATLVIATHDARVMQALPNANVLAFDTAVPVTA